MAKAIKLKCAKCSQEFILKNGILMSDQDKMNEPYARNSQMASNFIDDLRNHSGVCGGEVGYQNLIIELD